MSFKNKKLYWIGAKKKILYIHLTKAGADIFVNVLLKYLLFIECSVHMEPDCNTASYNSKH